MESVTKINLISFYVQFSSTRSRSLAWVYLESWLKAHDIEYHLDSGDFRYFPTVIVVRSEDATFVRLSLNL